MTDLLGGNPSDLTLSPDGHRRFGALLAERIAKTLRGGKEPGAPSILEDAERLVGHVRAAEMVLVPREVVERKDAAIADLEAVAHKYRQALKEIAEDCSHDDPDLRKIARYASGALGREVRL